MSAEELAKMSLADLAEAYAGRHLSPVEVMETTLDPAQAVNPFINALFSFRPEQAIAGARQSEARWKSNAPLGPLDGVPMTVKDSVAMVGWPYLHGIRANRSLPPSNYDSPPRDSLTRSGCFCFCQDHDARLRPDGFRYQFFSWHHAHSVGPCGDSGGGSAGR